VQQLAVANHSRRVGFEGEGDACSDEASEENVHGPLPALGLSLLAGLDTPEPSGGRFELVLATTSSSSGGNGEAPGGLSGVSNGASCAEGRDGGADDCHCIVEGQSAMDGGVVINVEGWRWLN
jgi:hypothetical protein